MVNASKKETKAATPTKTTTPAKGKSAPKNAKSTPKASAKAKAASVKDAADPTADAQVEAATVKVKAHAKSKTQPKAILPEVMPPAPELIATDMFVGRVNACTGHSHWSEINNRIRFEFDKYQATGEVTKGTTWAVNTAERDLKSLARTAAKAQAKAEADADETAKAKAWIDEYGADIVLRAITCTKSLFWPEVRKFDGRNRELHHKLNIIAAVASGGLVITTKNVAEVHNALMAAEEALETSQVVVVHNGQKAKAMKVGANSRGVKQGLVLVQPLG